MEGKGSGSYPPPESVDRRADPRIAVELEVNFESLDEFVSAYTHDVSRTGLFVPTDKFLPMGAVVALSVKLPDRDKPIRAIARVAYILDGQKALQRGRKPGLGMEFLDVGGVPFADHILAYLKATGSAPAPSDLPPANPHLALVVDDEPLAREKVSASLAEAGFRVIVAKDGLEALGQAMRERPDIILTDVTMPGLDGWQLLRILRSRPNLATIPVIFLTRLTSDTERLKGYRLGVDDYVGKPFTGLELTLRVQRVIARNRQAQGSNKALRGDLSQVSLASLLSLAEMERRTGNLLLVRNGETVRLHLRDGAVMRIDLPEEHSRKPPIDRFFYVLDWMSGQFELSSVEVPAEDALGLRTSFVLLEHARRKDER